MINATSPNSSALSGFSRVSAIVTAPTPVSAPTPVPVSTPASAYGRDQFVRSTGYVSQPAGQNILYGEGKNIGLRLIDKSLGLKSSYIEAAFIDKTPHNPMDIEEVDFNLHVKAGEVAVTDVDATLTIETILRRKQTDPSKPLPVQDLRVAFNYNNRIDVEGKVKALGMSLPFKVSGTVAADTAGQIRYDLGKAKVAGIPVNGLMKTFGLSLEKLLKLNNPADGYYAQGNSLMVDIGRTVSQMDGAPGLQAQVRGVRTHLGQLQILVGDTPEDAQRALEQKQTPGPNYIKAQGDHAYIDGFFLKDGQISIYDRTPGSPLNINYKGEERSIVLHNGYVGITAARFQELIQEEMGNSDDLSNVKTSLQANNAKVSGKLMGFIPLSLNMEFKPTDDGRLMFEPSGAKAFGFVPLPNGLLRSKLQTVVKGGEPYGKGVALGQISGIDLGKVKAVDHQKDYIVLTTGTPVAGGQY